MGLTLKSSTGSSRGLQSEVYQVVHVLLVLLITVGNKLLVEIALK